MSFWAMEQHILDSGLRRNDILIAHPLDGCCNGVLNGREMGIQGSDPSVPNAVLCQVEPRPMPS